MVNLYIHGPNAVKVVTDAGFPAVMAISSPKIPGDQNANIIVTGVSGANSGGHQFLHTLSHFIYVYVFGERVGDLTVTGKTVLHPCHAAGAAGISAVSNYYLAHGIARYGTPVAIAIGSVGLSGFLVELKSEINNPNEPFGDFSLVFKTI